jgi:hypothetical protein
MEIYNIPAHKRGDTFKGLEFTFTYSDGTPVDLTNVVILAKFKQRPQLTRTFSVGTAAGTMEITDAANGKAEIKESIINWPYGVYEYDVELTFSTGYRDTPVGGIFPIENDITDH